MSSYPANKPISPELLDRLLEEFGGFVNSKRIRSRINTISELINLLWKQNVFYADKNVLKTISKYISSEEQNSEMHCHLNTLCQNENAYNSGNIYGVCTVI